MEPPPIELTVADRLGLAELVARYAHGVDARDPDAVTALFTPDARLEFVSTAAVHVGRDAIAEFFRGAFGGALLAAGTASTHLMTNTVMTPDGDGDAARLVTSAVSYLATGDAATVVVRGLTYTDRAVRGPEGWLLAERVHRLHWQARMPGGPATTEPPAGPGAGAS